MVTIDGVEYNDSTQIDWDTAEEIGGFYFSRARYLNLPLPPAAFVALDDMPQTDEQLQVIAAYHSLMCEAEANQLN